MLERTQPIVAILDLHHPGRDGLALCLELKRRPNPPGVVLYSANTPATLVVAAAVAGADTIVGKSCTAAALVEAIRTVARNRRTIPPITPRMRADAAAKLDPQDAIIGCLLIATGVGFGVLQATGHVAGGYERPAGVRRSARRATPLHSDFTVAARRFQLHGRCVGGHHDRR